MATSSNEKINQIKKDVNETTQIMKNNIDIVVKRGENLNELENKTKELAIESSIFRRKAKDLKKYMCMQNAKTTAIIVCVIMIIIGIIILAIYARTNNR